MENKNGEVVEVKEKKTAKERFNDFKQTKVGKIVVTAVKVVVVTAGLAGGIVLALGIAESRKGSDEDSSEETIESTCEVIDDSTSEE